MEWWIALIVAAIAFAILIGNFRVYSYYEWTNDRKFTRAIPGKLLVLFCMELALCTPSFFILDRYQPQMASGGDVKPFNGGIMPFTILFLVNFFVASFFIPFTIGFYKADDDARLVDQPPWLRACKRGAIYLLLNVVIVAAIYFGTLKGLDLLLALDLIYFAICHIFFWVACPVGIIAFLAKLIETYAGRKHFKISYLQRKQEMATVGQKAQTLRQCGNDIQDLIQKLQEDDKKPPKRVTAELNSGVQTFISEARELEEQFDRLGVTKGPIYYFNVLLLLLLSSIVYGIVIIDLCFIVAGETREGIFAKLMTALHDKAGTFVVDALFAYVWFLALLWAQVYSVMRLLRISWLSKITDVILSIKRLKKGETLAESLISVAMVIFTLSIGTIFAMYRMSRAYFKNSSTSLLLFEFTMDDEVARRPSKFIHWLTTSHLFPLIFLIILGVITVYQVIKSVFFKKKRRGDPQQNRNRVDALSAKIAGLNSKIIQTMSPDPLTIGKTALAANKLM